MSSDLVLAVRGVGKHYIIRHRGERPTTVSEAVLRRLHHPLRRSVREEFWALRDVCFDVHKGEVLGIIGRNGAGKSTLLKILSRITAPSTGQVDVYGKVGSLLEVGTGFHPELTGRENIFLNGTILGMRRREIERQFDAIVAFAGVEQFLDTPVKRYSSGMYVRLAFAVAAHLRTDILLVDEVLAVGDNEFQKKCLGKLHEVAEGGRTVLYVSHQMQSVAQLCQRALLLDAGSLAFDASAQVTVAHYVQELAGAGGGEWSRRRWGSGEVQIQEVRSDPPKRVGEPYRLKMRISRKEEIGQFFVSIHIVNEDGLVLVQCDSRLHGMWFKPVESQWLSFVLTDPTFKPGGYRVDAFICAMGILDAVEGVDRFEVPPLLPFIGAAPAEATAHGVVFAGFDIDVSSEDAYVQ